MALNNFKSNHVMPLHFKGSTFKSFNRPANSLSGDYVNTGFSILFT